MVSRRAAERLRAGHLWVYRSDVETWLPRKGDAELQAGELVSLMDSRRIPLGSAIYSSASQIALRKVSDEPRLTREQYVAETAKRVREAIALRRPMLGLAAGAAETDSCRLVFSEADALPGIIADKYNDLVLLQLLTQGTAQQDVRDAITAVLREELNPEMVLERPDPRIRELEELEAPSQVPLYSANASGEAKSATVATLNGLRFNHDANAGQKTGAFLDQRLNYAAAARYAKGRALDVCTYQGGFALHLATRCDSVMGIDQSRAALEVAERNLELNREKIKAEVEWLEGDAFEVLRAFEQQGEQYDTIVLDPPAFAKSKRAAEGAMRGYKELNLRAIKMLRPGGVLVTCSCSHHVSLVDFTATVASAASDARRKVRLLETRAAAPDHPEVLNLPETMYLKCLILAVD